MQMCVQIVRDDMKKRPYKIIIIKKKLCQTYTRHTSDDYFPKHCRRHYARRELYVRGLNSAPVAINGGREEAAITATGVGAVAWNVRP